MYSTFAEIVPRSLGIITKILLGTSASSGLFQFGMARPAMPPGFVSPPNTCANQIPAENAYIQCREPVYEFGHIRGGPDRPLWHAFEIENICDRPVRVQLINPGCGTCARDKSWIQPSQSVFFDVKLLTNYQGPVTKRITVEVIELGDPIDSAN